MRRLRPFAALLLALALIWGSVAEAVARNQMEGATDQVICGSMGAETIRIDASGNPVAAHPCTHCLAANTMALLATAPGTATPPRFHRASRLAPAIALAPGRLGHTPSARAPPPSV